MSEAKLNEQLAEAGLQMRALAKAKNERIRELEAEVSHLKKWIEQGNAGWKAEVERLKRYLNEEPALPDEGGGRESGDRPKRGKDDVLGLRREGPTAAANPAIPEVDCGV